MTETMTMGVGQRADRNSAIANALRSFAEVRGATMRMVAGLTSDQASFTPGAGGWSVAQNLDHLLLTEALYRGQIRKLLDLAREGKKTNIDVSLGEVDLSLPFVPKMMMPLMAVPLTMMNMFVPSALRETVLRFPIMKAKNPRISEPAKGKPIADLREQLQAAMEETEAMLSGELPANAWTVTVSHPVFGRNTIANVLGLMSAHEERHGIQMSNLMRQRGFPAGVAA